MLDRTVRLQRVASGLMAMVRDELENIERRTADAEFGIAIGLPDALAEIRERLRVAFGEVAVSQIAFAEALFNPAPPLTRTGDPAARLPEVMGASFDDWFEKIGADLNLQAVPPPPVRLGTLADKFRTSHFALRTSSTDPAAEMHTNFLAGVFAAALRAIEALIRTMLQAILNAATRQAVTRSFRDGYQWQQISVLDARTSQICRRYAFAVWDSDFKPVGHSLPFAGGVPRHWHCRSIIVPVFGNSPQMTVQGWMSAAGRQRMEDLFGPRHLALFHRGLLTLADLVRQTSRPLTPAALSKNRFPS